MKTFFLLSVFFSLSTEAAMEKEFLIGGKKTLVTVTKLDTIQVTGKTISAVPEVDVYLKKAQYLSEGKVKEASALTTNPAEFLKEMEAYRKRVGDGLFRKNLGSLLTLKLTLTHLIRKGPYSVLIGSHPEDGIFGVIFECKEKKCLLEESFEGAAMKEMGPLFQEIQQGKVKL